MQSTCVDEVLQISHTHPIPVVVSPALSAQETVYADCRPFETHR
jgi:hypothetical protein